MLVLSLELAGLVSGVGLERSVKSQLEAGHQLLVVDGGVEAVVGVPLLGNVKPVVVALILGLQAPGDLAGVHGGVTSSSELDSIGGLGLDLQLDEPEMVALSEDISGLFANIRVGWRSHGFDSV